MRVERLALVEPGRARWPVLLVLAYLVELAGLDLAGAACDLLAWRVERQCQPGA